MDGFEYQAVLLYVKNNSRNCAPCKLPVDNDIVARLQHATLMQLPDVDGDNTCRSYLRSHARSATRLDATWVHLTLFVEIIRRTFFSISADKLAVSAKSPRSFELDVDCNVQTKAIPDSEQRSDGEALVTLVADVREQRVIDAGVVRSLP